MADDLQCEARRGPAPYEAPKIERRELVETLIALATVGSPGPDT